MTRRLALIAMLCLLSAACASGDNGGNGGDGGNGGNASASANAPRTVPLTGAPNGVAVRAADGAVFVTDDKANGIAMTSNIDDASPDFSLYARIPAQQGERVALSQIAFAPNGHLLVERFGFGRASAVFDIAASGQVALAADANPSRRRLGLLVLDSGTFLSSWFEKEGDTPSMGGVSVVTRGATPGSVTERDLVKGLGKPVGLAVVGDTLFISDQAASRILRVDLQAARSADGPVQATDVFASVDAPDLMAASPDGTLYTKCGAHALCSVSARGRATVIANDFESPRGVAVDVARKRLIAVDRAGASGKPSALRVLPIK